MCCRHESHPPWEAAMRGERFLAVVLLLTCLTASHAANQTAPARPDLSGVWLVDSAAGYAPSFLIRSKLTLSADAFALSGYCGIEKPWTGNFTLGANGDARNLDLRCDAFDMSQRGTPLVYPAASVRGISKLEASPDGDRLTICFAIHDDAPRPSEFKATDDTKLATFV